MATEKSEYRVIPLKSIIADPTRNRKVSPDDEGIKLMASAMKARGFASEEPLICTADPDGKRFHLDAGYRRHCAASIAGLENVPVLVKYRKLDDLDARAADKARENATEPLTWAEQAQTAAMFSSRELAASTMVVTPKHVGYLLAARSKLDAHISQGTLPEESLSIPFAAARELSQFPKAEIAEAYNTYVETGSLPDREKKNEGGGRGEGTAEKKKLWKKLCKDVPHVPWALLQDKLKLREKSDLEWLINEFAPFVDEGAASLNPLPKVDKTGKDE